MPGHSHMKEVQKSLEFMRKSFPNPISVNSVYREAIVHEAVMCCVKHSRHTPFVIIDDPVPISNWAHFDASNYPPMTLGVGISESRDLLEEAVARFKHKMESDMITHPIEPCTVEDIRDVVQRAIESCKSQEEGVYISLGDRPTIADINSIVVQQIDEPKPMELLEDTPFYRKLERKGKRRW